MSFANDITYSKEGKIAIIKFNSPKNLNACSFLDYQRLSWLLEKADAEPDTIVTLLVSSGKYFSAGADILASKEGGPFSKKFDNDQEKRDYWVKNFMANNTYLTKAVYSHKKVLVTALNGPAIGLSAAVVALSDLIYAKKSKNMFLLLPFANLGLVSEGGSAISLFHRLGLSKANEALLLSRPIHAADLDRAGFFNKVYDIDNVEEFNKQVIKDLTYQVEGLNMESIKLIKQLIQDNYRNLLVNANLTEAALGVQRFEKGLPQQRFKDIKEGRSKHKL